MLNMENRVCLIIGAAAGIGQSVVAELNKLQAIVVAVDKDSEGLERLALSHPFANSKSRAIQADICSLESILSLSCKLEQIYGHIDSLANIAASAHFQTFTNDYSLWEETMKGSVAAYSVICAQLNPLMRSGGSIVNMASVSAHVAQAGYGTYSASKAAIIALSRCMANELAGRNIRVNTVSPGTVWTRNNAKHIIRIHGIDRAEADCHPDIGGKHVLKRCAEPHEIAQPIVFLMSDMSTFITGTDLKIDGGYTLF